MFFPVFAAIVSTGAVRAPADTIYSLAVDSTKYRTEPFVYLLDDGVLRVEADGRGSRTYRQVIQILRQSAVEQWAEYSFTYEPKHQRLTVNWMRVVSPTGEVISDKPGIAQDADVPAPMGDPTYVEQKVRRMSLPNVRPGMLVDYSYTIEELNPFRPGDFFSAWRITTGLPVRRSRLVLDTPVSFSPRIVERNLPFKPVVREADGRRVTTWAAQDVPRIDGEPFAADSNGVMQTIEIGAPSTWHDIGAWYARLARDRYAVTPQVEQKLAAIVAGARSLDDSIKAIHHYVAKDVRYVAIALGQGGYQPRSPADVVTTGYGDCKDKATLFIALMTRLGVQANPVLLSAGGKVERELPTIAQFNHAIAAVDRPSGRLFVDLTAGDVPWGALPSPDQGQFVLVVHPDGRTEEVVTPEDDVSSVGSVLTISGDLDTTGHATTHARMSMSGSMGLSLRAALGESSDSAGRDAFLRQIASGIYPEAEGDSLRLIDQTTAGGTFSVDFVARSGRAAQLAGSVAVLSLPFIRQQGDVKPLIAELRAHPPRRFPIDVEEVSPRASEEVRVRLELPEGWRAQLPKSVSLSGDFGTFSIAYAQEGRVLTVIQRRAGRKAILPPERVEDLIRWLEQVSVASRGSDSIVLSRPA